MTVGYAPIAGNFFRKKVMQKIDLSLLSVEVLLEEIKKRYDCFVFSGIQLRGGDRTMTSRKWSGNHMIASGLVSQLQIAIYDKSQEEAEEIGEEPFEE
jgi:hypothetical protein